MLLLSAFLLIIASFPAIAQEAGGITEVTIERLSSGELIFDVGSQDGVRIGDQYEVIRDRAGAGLGQYDQLAVIEIVKVIEDGSRAKILKKAKGVEFQAGDVLSIRWLVPGTVGGGGDENQRFFMSLQFGTMSFTDDGEKVECWANMPEVTDCVFSDYELSSFWGGSLGIQISKRFDLLGTFTMAFLKADRVYVYIDEYQEDYYYEESDGETYSTSLSTRIAIYRTSSFVTFAKVGAWLLIDDDSASEVGFGARTGLGMRWEPSNVFGLGVEVDVLTPFTPEDAFTRYGIALVPEFTIVSW
jgi:hypothetical protein